MRFLHFDLSGATTADVVIVKETAATTVDTSNATVQFSDKAEKSVNLFELVKEGREPALPDFMVAAFTYCIILVSLSRLTTSNTAKHCSQK